MIVVTPCFYPNEEPIKLLKATCAHHGLKLHPYGIGCGWKGTVGGDTHAQFVALPPILDSLPDDLVLFTDGADVLALADERTILDKYHRLGSPVVVAAEPGCYPPRYHEPFLHKYPDYASCTWRFPNFGGWLGPRLLMAETLWHLASYYQETMEAQARVLEYFLSDQSHALQLDTGCEIFQCMSGGLSESIKINKGLVLNTITGTSPCFIHWNGRGGGTEAAYAILHG